MAKIKDNSDYRVSEKAADDKVEKRNEDLLVEIEVLRDELASVRETADIAKDDLLRKAADLDNARKRLQRERLQIQERAAERIIRALLPSLNDLARAIEIADADDAVPQHHVDAIVMMEKKVFDILRVEGLEAVDAKPGDVFDPEIHEAVMAACQPDIEPGCIISVMEGGYKFKGRLLIPARVEVCVEETGDNDDEDGQSEENEDNTGAG